MTFELPKMPILAAWRNWSLRFHKPLLVLAMAIFVAGTIWSVRDLQLSAQQLNGTALAALICLSPMTLVYSGLGLQLMAKAADTRIPFGKSIVTSAIAILAEALPIPGGAIVRTGALMKAGAGLGQGAGLVLLTAVLWIMLGALGAGLAILGSNASAGWTLVAAGIGGTAASLGYLWRQSGFLLALLILVHRLSGIGLVALRLYLAFHVLGITFPFVQSMPFVLAIIAGSAASIAPAGLGISEALAALAAASVAVPPAAAFLAVGLDRLVHLLASAGVSIQPLLKMRFVPPESGHSQPEQDHSNARN